MALLDSLFGKKKPTLKAQCPITKESIEMGFGYMLTTAEVISSRKYWDMVMTEPETMSYTVSHFKNQRNGTQMRSMIFEKHSTKQNPWMVSDSCINLFEDIDKNEARNRAKKWWESQGNFVPERSGAANEVLDTNTFNNWKDYAVLEAGRSRVIL
jgi:hypothetical protein